MGHRIHVSPDRPLATAERAVVVEALLTATTSIELDPAAAPVREIYPLGGWRTVLLRLTRTLTTPASSESV